MNLLGAVIHAILEPQQIITAFGLFGVIFVIFAETGLFIGFFLPGDSLLFSAGLLSSQGLLPFWPLVIGVFLAAVLGDNFGYWFGLKTGPALFKREDSRFFKKKYLEQTKAFYETHGKKTIIMARFMPIIRTFAPIVAGVGQMRYRIFVTYNVVGAFIWAVGVTVLGYFLGSVVPNIDKYLLPIILIIAFSSFIPPILHLYRRKRKKMANNALEGQEKPIKM